MTSYRKTTATARQIGVPPSQLLGWVRHGVIPIPQRDDSGHYLWDESLIAAACQARDERLTRPDSPHETLVTE
jgi:hypothetical protein